MSHRRTRTCIANAAACLALLGVCTPGATVGSPSSATTSSSVPGSRAASVSPNAAAQTTPTSGPGLDETRPINADNQVSSIEGLLPVRSDNPVKALVLTGIPATPHEGFRCVVLKFSGRGIPGAQRGAWADDAFE